MAKTSMFLFLFLVIIVVGISATGSILSNEDPPIINKYIWRSCKVTMYQRICYGSLVSYATYIDEDPIHLAIAAINITRGRLIQVNNNFLAIKNTIARNTSAVEPMTAAIMDVCIEMVELALDMLDESDKEVEALVDCKEGDKASHINNAVLWVGAAVTDQGTCLDEFSNDGTPPDLSVLGKHIKTFVFSRMNTTMSYTSNTLSLVKSLESSD
ncbi:Pectinesterase [Zostera marina]|uniref:Pectinesterase n=1 Tax=Zostera marina TaxID=29655 RepID=A0A0K9Q2S4_ZOSMR|nr:Pectinesterase [Zostera marina]